MPRESIRYLDREKFDCFDMNEVHLRDFIKYSIPFDAYLKIHSIGHCNRHGNHLSANSIKDTVVKWLDPKPVAYLKAHRGSIDFEAHLVDCC